MIDDKTLIIALIIIIINLIISGIIGLIKKSINMHSVIWGIMFFPLGIIGAIFSKVFSYSKKPDEGNVAIVSSIGCFAIALMLTAFLIGPYLPDSVANIIPPAMLIIVIIGLPVVIAVYGSKKE